MNRTRALALLAQSKPILAARYGVTQLALFGSTARSHARSDSDLMSWSPSMGRHRGYASAGFECRISRS